MASSLKRYLPAEREANFPYLTKDLYEVLEDGVEDYNCIAFAAGDKTRWWWPDPDGVYYWPIPKRESTVECFVKAFESLDYKQCAGSFEKSGFEKVALYHDPIGCVAALNHAGVPPNSPTHAAKQAPDGMWHSKLGGWELIAHKTLECLNGTNITGSRISYGEPIQILERILIS